MEALQCNEATIANTLFQTDPSKKVTFQGPNTKHKEPPWTPERHAELDFAIPNKRSRHTIENIEADTTNDFPSDYFPLIISLRHKINKVEDIEPNPRTYGKEFKHQKEQTRNRTRNRNLANDSH